MKLNKCLGLVCLLWAGAAGAQTAATDSAAAACPGLSTEATAVVGWQARNLPDGKLYCRALRNDNNEEVFAVMLGEDLAFRPRRGDRAETGTIEGFEVQWYRGVDAIDPSAQLRETLVELSDDREIHIFLRAPDAATLPRYMELAQSLRLPAPPAD